MNVKVCDVRGKFKLQIKEEPNIELASDFKIPSYFTIDLGSPGRVSKESKV